MLQTNTNKQETTPGWSVEKSAELYGIHRWGKDFFDISKKGEVTVRLKDNDKDVNVSLPNIIKGLRERGLQFPVLLRFGDILESRIAHLNESFLKAIQDANYNGTYRGVYPIKVNQQQEVIQEVTNAGRKYHYGLEAGSKPELIAALAYMHDPEAYIICNGYKDEEFIDLALNAQKMGLKIVLVIEMPGELNLILARAKALKVQPMLGVRAKLATKSSGHWSESAGDQSVFGLNMAQIIELVDHLKETGNLDCLRMLHFHQGSQVPDIINMRQAATEAARIYTELVREGAPMGLFNMGGGLAINYIGTRMSSTNSSNYDIREYCADMIEIIKSISDEAGIEHPDLISESGRAIVAYYSVLIFNILDTNKIEPTALPKKPEDGSHEILKYLFEAYHSVKATNLQESLNDAIYYRDKLRSLFVHGVIGLRERGIAEKVFWNTVQKISTEAEKADFVSEDLQEIKNAITDIYYGNFSVFQSLPDSWAIDQLFPTMPIHRLKEEPTRDAVIADITCDCDGKIDRFIDQQGERKSIPVHNISGKKDYMIGIFLVGAYQETLGDLHNLLGDTHVVSVKSEKGKIKYIRETAGDSVSDVLSYVEYDPKDLVSRFRNLAEQAVTEGLISAKQRHKILGAYESGIRGYTYFESP